MHYSQTFKYDVLLLDQHLKGVEEECEQAKQQYFACLGPRVWTGYSL